MQKVIEMAMKDVDPEQNRDYHISFDIDALDRSEAPSTGYACTQLFFFYLFFCIDFSTRNINFIYFYDFQCLAV